MRLSYDLYINLLRCGGSCPVVIEEMTTRIDQKSPSESPFGWRLYVIHVTICFLFLKYSDTTKAGRTIMDYFVAFAL